MGTCAPDQPRPRHRMSLRSWHRETRCGAEDSRGLLHGSSRLFHNATQKRQMWRDVLPGVSRPGRDGAPCVCAWAAVLCRRTTSDSGTAASSSSSSSPAGSTTRVGGGIAASSSHASKHWRRECRWAAGCCARSGVAGQRKGGQRRRRRRRPGPHVSMALAARHSMASATRRTGIRVPGKCAPRVLLALRRDGLDGRAGVVSRLLQAMRSTATRCRSSSPRSRAAETASRPTS